MKHTIKTTVIGSYPIPIDTMELMHTYFDQRKEIPWAHYIDAAVQDMVTAGIDIVSDGQTRDPFIQLFTRKLHGCRNRSRPEVIDKVAYCGPIIVDDQKYVKQILPQGKQLKGVLTGPYTLAQSCVDLFYHDEKQLAFDFAHALRKEAELLQNDVDMISIDEPFFSQHMPAYGTELIGTITKHLSCPTMLHACGDVSKVVPELVQMPVTILSHEFKASPQLFDVFQEYDFPHSLCVGSVRSDDPRVESVEEIVSHINKAITIFGEKIIQISPDCGQRLLPRDVAYKKLQNLVQAGRIINGG